MPSSTVISTRTWSPCGVTDVIRPTPMPSTFTSESEYTPTAFSKYAVIFVPDWAIVIHHSAALTSRISASA